MLKGDIMFLQRVKEMFNLNIPMGRLRYFLTTVIIYLIVCSVLILVTPNVIIYEGEENLFNTIKSGVFDTSEVLLYFLIGDIILYAFLFALNSKRILAITNNKNLSIIVSSVFLITDIISEYLVTSSVLNFGYFVLTLIIFLFLCLKKGTSSKTELN